MDSAGTKLNYWASYRVLGLIVSMDKASIYAIELGPGSPKDIQHRKSFPGLIFVIYPREIFNGLPLKLQATS